MKKFTVMLVLLFSIFFYTDHTKADSGSQLIIINKKINQLAYYNGGTLVKTFRVATGRDDSLTPEGNFKIVTKIVNRPYYTGNIPGGDPRNPLGNRWMGLNARGTYGTTYAIHGNNNENSIGYYVSSGCVRMHNDEVRWLFDQVQLYTTVIITNTNDTFDTIAASNGYYVVSGWKQANGKWYFYDGNGTMKTGWLLDGGKWYYL
ncbi:L,D-transpeptidase family protein, partial [Bacillus rhizoplanae]|uniref:L,D-transpeptidase n=1 Tax=Bacillus rhizoplanae TaxID=2880966 RepID=UPI003D1978A3